MRTENVEMLEDTLHIFRRGSYKYGEGSENEHTVNLKLTDEEQRKSVVLLPEQIQGLIDKQSVVVNQTESEDKAGDRADAKVDVNANVDADANVESVNRTLHTCENADSFSAALRIYRKYENSNVLVLNFANPVNPGGGVRRGAKAQEEDLCRKSSLLVALEHSNARSYYEYNKSLGTYMGSDAIILTPKVEIIKDSDGDLMADSAIVSVMTCAAPMVTYGLEGMTQNEYEAMLYNRIVKMLTVAVEYKYRYLVLGAWGCGAFGNDAKIVAKLFYKALKDFRYKGLEHEAYFDVIDFAVLSRSYFRYNFNAFNDYFSDFYRE